jgi:hypothetical protein
MADRRFGILRHQPFELGLGVLVLEVGGARAGEEAGELCSPKGRRRMASHASNRNLARRYFIGGSDARIIMGDDEGALCSGFGAKSVASWSQRISPATSSSNSA